MRSRPIDWSRVRRTGSGKTAWILAEMRVLGADVPGRRVAAWRRISMEAWWRRRESNPRPEKLSSKRLHA